MSLVCDFNGGRLSIKQTIINRDGITSDQADSLINEAIDALNDYVSEGDLVSAENICEEFFGLEPDYVDDLI